MQQQRVLITGGAGFIGTNLAERLIAEGHSVTIFDNLSRPGCAENVTYLRDRFGVASFLLVQGDVADFDALRSATYGAQRVYHLAGQVAVTQSIANPRKDFQDNALGTFNALEAARAEGDQPVFVYASTNKVYGALNDLPIEEQQSRYAHAHLPHGVPETQPLSFHSPYGCSKGAGDQYTSDYARIFGLRSVVMRQSCIYGARQLGVEDQGWLAWFVIAALRGRPITVYGDGKQVRDVLYVSDLLDAYEAAVLHIDRVAGETFNIGGGPRNTISVWCEFGPMLSALLGRPVGVRHAHWRPGDQRVYVSDIRKAQDLLGWQPRVDVADGLGQLHRWVSTHMDLFSYLP